MSDVVLPDVEVSAERDRPEPLPAAPIASGTRQPDVTSGSSYVRRRLELIYTLGKDTFDGVQDTIKLSNLRMGATILKSGAGWQGVLELQVFGLSPNHMAQMTVYAGEPGRANPFNGVTLLAGSEGGPMSVAYQGTVLNAFPDMRASPQVPFNVVALGAAGAAQQAVPPSSYDGAVDAATMLEALAKAMNFKFENNGASAKLATPYYAGSALAQAEQIARDADIHMTVDDGTLAIWPKSGTRKGGQIPLISAKTGMIGYPVVNQIGIDVTCLYSPTVRIGSRIKVESTLQRACGEWQVIQVGHYLACETPGGAWFSQLSCTKPGLAVPL